MFHVIDNINLDNRMPKTRMIKMEGAMNFRDLGGIQLKGNSLTRNGVLFRSDGLSRLTVRDLKKFESLKINSVLDLRHSEEIAKAPDKLPRDMTVQSINCGFYAKGTMKLFQAVNSGKADVRESKSLMRQVYAKMPIEHIEEIQKIIRYVLQSEKTPCLIHCMSGKDRTGLIIAIILKAIGAPMPAIIRDYEMSNGEYQTVDVFDEGAQQESITAVMAADPSYLLASFAAIEKVYGSFDNYITKALMLTDSELNQLSHVLSE